MHQPDSRNITRRNSFSAFRTDDDGRYPAKPGEPASRSVAEPRRQNAANLRGILEGSQPAPNIIYRAKETFSRFIASTVTSGGNTVPSFSGQRTNARAPTPCASRNNPSVFYDLLGQLVEGIDRINCDNFKSILFAVTHLIIIQSSVTLLLGIILHVPTLLNSKTFNQSRILLCLDPVQFSG